MTNARRILLPLFRLAGITQVVLGILFWTGRVLNLAPLHMGIGMLFVGLYLFLILTARVGKELLTVALLLGFAIPVFGIMHTRLLIGDLHWIVQVTHLLLGGAAMGVVDRTNKALNARGTAAA